MKKTLTLALALAPLSGFADDRSADARQLSPTSRAERLSDAQLDQVTAGAIEFALHAVFNPGNADNSKTNGNQLHFVIGNSGDKASGVVFIVNPARTVFKCVGGGTGCF
jgi:hypothetical protein